MKSNTLQKHSYTFMLLGLMAVVLLFFTVLKGGMLWKGDVWLGIAMQFPEYGVVTLEVETDRGNAVIEIRNLLYGMKLLYGSRVLLRDGSDNRYEIPDLTALDKQSRQKIDCFL